MTENQRPVIWCIGGTDCASAAGLSIDINVANSLRVHACGIVSAVTAQSINRFLASWPVTAEQLTAQLDCLMEQLPPDFIKVGMLGSVEILQALVKWLNRYSIPLIVDPVVQSSSDGALFASQAKQLFIEKLLPKTSLLTPNAEEMEWLTGDVVRTPAAFEQAARKILAMGPKAVFAKGGHMPNSYEEGFVDFFINDEESFYLHHDGFNKGNVRGTGCALATAITGYLAWGYSAKDAVVLGKALVTKGMREAEKLEGQNVFFQFKHPIEVKDYPSLSYQRMKKSILNFPCCDTKKLGLYPVVDSIEWVEKLVAAGVTTMQLRIKDQPEALLRTQIMQACQLAKKNNIRLFINDYWREAIEYGAYGVHLGQEDLHDANLHRIADAGLRLGISTHADFELARALAVRPSYIAIGPVFATDSKQMPFKPQGLPKLKNWVSKIQQQYPVVAIGGINLDNAKATLQTGVGSIAMISAITQAENWQEVVKQLLTLVDES